MARRALRALPDVPLRAVAYIRVSDEGGRGDNLLSPDIQLTAIRDHCERAGYALIETIQDIDRTGRLWKRRKIEAAVRMIEERHADVIVVWKISRVARNRKDWAIAVDRVESVGGTLESATEPNETTSSGRFARGMLAELAAFESERIGETWREVHAQRVASGRPANGKPRFGYRYDSETKTHMPDPETGPVLADLYRRYVAGESVYALVRWLNTAGYRTIAEQGYAGTGVWSERTLRRVLDSGFGAGKFTARGMLHDGVHEPVIDADLWSRYQEQRVRRRAQSNTERSQYVLSGLLRCTICEGRMVGGQFGAGRVPKFRCKRGKETGLHQGGYVTMRVVEESVRDWLEREVAADIDTATARQIARQSTIRRSKSDAELLARRVLDVDHQIREGARQLVRGVLPEGAWLELRADLEAERERLVVAQAEASAGSRVAEVGPALQALLDGWETLPVAVRREMLRRLVREVRVTPGRPRSTVEVVPIWTGDPGS